MAPVATRSAKHGGRRQQRADECEGDAVAAAGRADVTLHERTRLARSVTVVWVGTVRRRVASASRSWLAVSTAAVSSMRLVSTRAVVRDRRTLTLASATPSTAWSSRRSTCSRGRRSSSTSSSRLGTVVGVSGHSAAIRQSSSDEADDDGGPDDGVVVPGCRAPGRGRRLRHQHRVGSEPGGDDFDDEEDAGGDEGDRHHEGEQATKDRHHRVTRRCASDRRSSDPTTRFDVHHEVGDDDVESTQRPPEQPPHVVLDVLAEPLRARRPGPPRGTRR